MISLSVKKSTRLLFNVFVLASFVLGMLTLAPMDAIASPAAQQGTGWEQGSSPLSLYDLPIEWTGSRGNLSSPLIQAVPGLAQVFEPQYIPQPLRRPNDIPLARPQGAMLDPQRPSQVTPDISELPSPPNADQRQEFDRDVDVFFREVRFERGGPFFTVDLKYNEVFGFNWIDGSTVSMAIDDPFTPGSVDYFDEAIVDEWGWVWFFMPGWFDLEPGQVVTMSDGTTTKVHTIINLAITDFDVDTNTISGTANPGELHIYAMDDDRGEYFTPIANGDGDWSQNLTPVAVGPGLHVDLSQSDEDGDFTDTSWNIPAEPNPLMRIDPQSYQIDGYGWGPDTLITLDIDGYAWTEMSDPWGYVGFYISPFVIQTGQVIEMTDGTHMQTHTVRLEITNIDQVNHSVSGNANPGSRINITACDNFTCQMFEQDVAIDGSGAWTAEFDGLVNIIPGSYGWVYEYDQQGNSIYLNWNVPKTRMLIYPYTREIEGYDWQPNETIILTIGTQVWENQSNPWGYVYFDIWSFEIESGQVVTMTDNTDIRTHTVRLEITGFDENLNLVSGKAAPLNTIEIFACDAVICETLFEDVNVDGEWTADFDNLVNITIGTSGWAYEYDEEGNSTRLEWKIPNPRMRIYPQWGEIVGVEWPPNQTISLTIDGQNWEEESDSWGDVFIDITPFEIQIGQEVLMTDFTITRTHIVSLEITEIDQDANTVSGKGTPFNSVRVTACDGFFCNWLTEEVSDTGDWTADFDGYVNIAMGIYGWAEEVDEQGNSTVLSWSLFDPFFQVYPLGDYIYGYYWTPYTMVKAFIDGNEIGQGWSNSDGWVFIQSNEYDITYGDIILLTDGSDIRTHEVKYLEVTGVYQTINIVSGKAEPFAERLQIEAFDMFGNWAHRNPEVSEFGNWSANFAGEVFITKGTEGIVVQADDERNQTVIYWYVPDPTMRVYPEDDFVTGESWPPFTSITMSIGSKSWTGISDHKGYVEFYTHPFDIQPGQLVTMTDGEFSKSHIVRNLAVSNIDIDTDTVSGTSAGGAYIVVMACDYDCITLTVTANQTGHWSADFTDMVVMQPGSYGAADQYDVAGDSTRVRWRVPDPFFIVRPNGDLVYGIDWTPNTAVTLRINGNLISTETSNAWGSVIFDQLNFDILPGHTVIVSDGIFSKGHEVIDLAVTSYTATTLSGKAEPGWLWIVAYDNLMGEFLEIEADSDGEWTAEFSAVTIDIGAEAYISQADEDQDMTEIFWFIPDPSIEVYPQDGRVFGTRWPANTIITLSIDANRDDWTEESDEFGTVFFNLEAIELLPGMIIQMEDESGTYSRDHIIRNITITEIDTDANTVIGLADPQSMVTICVFNASDQMFIKACLDIDVDEFGNWLADFAGQVNIARGTFGQVSQSDEHGHRTIIHWMAYYKAFLPVIIQ